MVKFAAFFVSQHFCKKCDIDHEQGKERVLFNCFCSGSNINMDSGSDFVRSVMTLSLFFLVPPDQTRHDDTPQYDDTSQLDDTTHLDDTSHHDDTPQYDDTSQLDDTLAQVRRRRPCHPQSSRQVPHLCLREHP